MKVGLKSLNDPELLTLSVATFNSQGAAKQHQKLCSPQHWEWLTQVKQAGAEVLKLRTADSVSQGLQPGMFQGPVFSELASCTVADATKYPKFETPHKSADSRSVTCVWQCGYELDKSLHC